MINRTLTRGLAVLFILCASVAMAAIWTVDFETNIRRGLIEKAIREALKENISPADIVNALEQALLNGIVPEGKTHIVEELVLSSVDTICDETCSSGHPIKCSQREGNCGCDCCSGVNDCPVITGRL